MSTDLAPLVQTWLDGMSGQLDPSTVELYRMHFHTHLIPCFLTLEGITRASIGEYGRRRLQKVRRKTLQKERSTLSGFLDWCVEVGHLADVPEFPRLARRALGTPYAQRRRGKATSLSPEECAALIAALPESSTPRGGRHAFPVRARFVVAYETALRPATLDALSVPEHYSPGSATLLIGDEDDKARFGREVPLTEAARAALDAVAPAGGGPIFGAHDYRSLLERAAAAVLPPTKARTFTAYDLRHARLTELAETGNLPGVAFLAGHKLISTTAIYVKPGQRAARSVLGASADASGQAKRTGTRIGRALAECTGAELRALPPPANEDQARLEWQTLVNALADQREKDERAAQATAARESGKRRVTAPREDAGLDEHILELIARGEFTSQRELRAEVRCCLARLRKSLDRLNRSGRINQVRTPNGQGGIRYVWRTV